MTIRPPTQLENRTCKPIFTETAAWESVGSGWRQLSGNFRELGYSIEWHDFTAVSDLDWSRSFHPGALEICLNLAGRAEVRRGSSSLELDASTVGYYAQQGSRLKAVRRGGDSHQFVTVEFSLPFLKSQVASQPGGMHPRLTNLLANQAHPTALVSEPSRLSSEHLQVVMSLRHPPVFAAAQPLWFLAKALEIAATILYQPLANDELLCQRVKRINRERVQKVRAILKENLTEPPSLEEIGRQVGCSHFYLSRIFTQEMGKTITACLRELRLERAAELLRTGQCNVTEAAFEVGYNSLSHFTLAFRETFGCCPGLYPLKTPTQESIQAPDRPG